MNAQELQRSVQGSGQVELLVNNGYHEVDGYGDPDLSLYRIGVGAEEVLDAEVTFDPAEKEFYLPAHLVKLRDDLGRDLQVVSQEDEILSGLRVVEAHLTQQLAKGFARSGVGRSANLIAAHPAGKIHR